MSQRGTFISSPTTLCPAFRRAHTRSILALAFTLIFGLTFTLTAQENLPVTPARTLSVCVAGQVQELTTTGLTVGDVLTEAAIELGQYDRVQPALSASVTEGTKIEVTRISCETLRERVAVSPPTISRFDRRMTTKPVVIRQGRPGVAVQTRIRWKKNGQVTEEWVQGKRLVTKPLPTIVIRGNLPSRAGITSRRILSVVATAYDPGPGSCGPHANGRTCIGMRAGRGIIAVDPRVIPLGSRVYVEGYGLAIAADVGGAIKGRRIDVCFPTRREALNWGRRTINVTVLE
jgi:3D (Asp-Asp-Asp) domain-containing protein